MIQNTKPKSKNKLLAFVLIGLIVAIGIYQAVKDDSEENQIKRDLRHGVAEIVKQEVNHKSKHLKLTYAFSEGSTTYVGQADYKPLTENGDSLAGHFFPLVYFSEDPNISRLVVTEQDFKKFDMNQPDSLKRHNALIE